MFHLEQTIREWREQLVHSGSMGADDAAELESHLRDEMDELVGRGITDDEAFLLAARRLGPPAELAAEFGKINSGRLWTRRVFWMVAGYWGVSLLHAGLVELGEWVSTGAILAGETDNVILHVSLHVALVGLAVVLGLVLTRTTGGRGRLVQAADRALRWGNRHPLWVLAFVFGVHAAVYVSSLGRSVWLVTVLDEATMGTAMLSTVYANWAMACLIPVILLVLLGWTHRKINRPVVG